MRDRLAARPGHCFLHLLRRIPRAAPLRLYRDYRVGNADSPATFGRASVGWATVGGCPSPYAQDLESRRSFPVAIECGGANSVRRLSRQIIWRPGPAMLPATIASRVLHATQNSLPSGSSITTWPRCSP